MGTTRTLAALKLAAEKRRQGNGQPPEPKPVAHPEPAKPPAPVFRRGSGMAIIVEAARELDQPFSFEQLVVAAWKKSPHQYGLRGFEQEHPDSNRVGAAIMGRGRLIERGFLERLGHGMYRLPGGTSNED